MYERGRKRKSMHCASAFGTVVAYALITCTVPLLHSDDCPSVPGNKGTHSSTENACPACNFLAGANATEVPCDLPPVLVESTIVPTTGWHLTVMVTWPCKGSIILRGPPAASLS